VIDLSRDEEAAAPAGGSGGGAALSGVLATFSCAVCFCDYGPEEGHALFCGHVFCRDCLGAHCKTQVADGLPDAAGIFCPEPRCRAPLTGADISAVADAATAARFEELALEKLIQSNSDSLGCALLRIKRRNGALARCNAERALRRCCPTPGCTFMFAWDPANRKLQCPKCNHAYCVVCKARCCSLAGGALVRSRSPPAQTDWHRGVRCEARGEREEQAEFEKAAMRGHFKKCPRCSVWVEKAEGCDSMRCRCGASFCYRCGSRMDRQHGALPFLHAMACFAQLKRPGAALAAAHRCVTPKGAAYFRGPRDW
jgi:hypothetical protein